MINSLLSKFALLLFLSFLMAFTQSYGQKTVLNANFNTSQGTDYTTTTGAIGGSIWNVSRSGTDFGAKIDGGLLTLTNDATTTTTNSNGWVSALTSTANIPDYNPILSQNPGIVSWTFNMRHAGTVSGFNNGHMALLLFSLEQSVLIIRQEKDMQYS